MTKLCKGDCFRRTVQQKKKNSDQVSTCAQREDKEWKYQKKIAAGGLACKLCREFNTVARSGQVEAAVAQRSELVLYS